MGEVRSRDEFGGVEKAVAAGQLAKMVLVAAAVAVVAVDLAHDHRVELDIEPDTGPGTELDIGSTAAAKERGKD